MMTSDECVTKIKTTTDEYKRFCSGDEPSKRHAISKTQRRNKLMERAGTGRDATRRDATRRAFEKQNRGESFN